MARVLLVDDEPDFRDVAAHLLRIHDHEISAAGTLAEARAGLDDIEPDVVLLDLMLPDGNGLELLGNLTESRSSREWPRRVVLMSGDPGIKSRIKHWSGPSLFFLAKPIRGMELLSLIDGLERLPTGACADPSPRFGSMVGDHESMRAMYRQIEKVAVTEAPVMIVGETGTGKELVAQAIHRASGRSGDFVALNCGAVPAELAGSELFGHEKGSFTGAVRQRTGRFELAEQGTLFLDELTEMSQELQAHLLRVLETRKVTRLGGEKELLATCRVIAATNREPETATKEGRLRQDLYFRLSAFPISVPALRDRPSDIPALVNHFFNEFEAGQGGDRHFSERSLRRLQAYAWPGNVRELRHVVQRALIMAADKGSEIPLPDRFGSPFTGSYRPGGVEPGRPIRDVERELIERTLAHFDGDKRNAAAALGVCLNTLYNRLHTYRHAKSTQ